MGTKNVTRILDIAIFVRTFCPHNVGFIYQDTHTHVYSLKWTNKSIISLLFRRKNKFITG